MYEYRFGVWDTYRPEKCRVWNYAMAGGQQLEDEWNIEDFEQGIYHLQVHGPNGFYRQFKGSANDPLLNLICQYNAGNIELKLNDQSAAEPISLEVTDHAYKLVTKIKRLEPGNKKQQRWL